MNTVAKRQRPTPLVSPAHPKALFHPPTLCLPRQALDPVDLPIPVYFSQVRATQAYLRSVEETEREKPRRARGSAAVVGVHE
jgi:hypothetical protein